MKLAKQLLREFWLPAAVALAWAATGVFWVGTNAPPWIAFVKDTAACFFLVSWGTGQYFRVKKQSQVETHLEGILARLSEVAGKIEAASAESTALMTGGDSYCYVSLHNMETMTNRGLLAVRHHGSHPLYDVRISIVDIDELERLASNASSLPLDAATKTVELATVYATGLSALKGWSLGDGPSPRRYNLEIRARNGAWSQQIRVVKLADRWVTATKVYRDGQLLVEEAYEDYPRSSDGSPVWD